MIMIMVYLPLKDQLCKPLTSAPSGLVTHVQKRRYVCYQEKSNSHNACTFNPALACLLTDMLAYDLKLSHIIGSERERERVRVRGREDRT